MGIRVALYEGSERRGEVEFRTLLVAGPDDYVCSPVGIISHDEATAISWGLRRLPAVDLHGCVGRFTWREESALSAAPDRDHPN
jgi:hypothetical protein